MGFQIILRYECTGCGAASKLIKLKPTGHPCSATIPCVCTRCGEFMPATMSMGLEDVREHLMKLERSRDDRLHPLTVETLKRTLERRALAEAFKMHPGNERLKVALLALTRRIEELENDQARLRRLPSELIAQCKTHESRLIEDGVTFRQAERLCPTCKVALIPLWPLPWETRSKIQGFPCPKCKNEVREEILSV